MEVTRQISEDYLDQVDVVEEQEARTKQFHEAVDEILQVLRVHWCFTSHATIFQSYIVACDLKH